jgi:phosphoribosyl-ATP pyrophosphohydrolase/phosphoribosyl-AMP cyclohydrolase
MVAWMNEAALRKTVETGKATFYSRSRQALWTKGETSGNYLEVRSIHQDCDADTLLLKVRALGPSCHTGQPTCFFTLYPDTESSASPSAPAPTFLHTLENEIAERARSSEEAKSYTKYLLDRGAKKISEKVNEEAAEFAQALDVESQERVASEAADLLYHVLVGLRLRDVPLNRVLEALAARAGVSGHDEKASRTKAD